MIIADTNTTKLTKYRNKLCKEEKAPQRQFIFYMKRRKCKRTNSTSFISQHQNVKSNAKVHSMTF